MGNRRLTIRADAGVTMGVGHVMRMLALGQAWQDQGGSVRLVGDAGPLESLLQRNGVTVVSTAGMSCGQSLDALLGNSGPGEWVVLDGYHFDTDYQSAVRRAGRKVLVLDDMNDRGEYHADALLNQNADAHGYDYRVNDDATVLAGPSFALLRKEFRLAERVGKTIPQRAEKIMITLGGGDSSNMVEDILLALAEIDAPAMQVKAVLGAVNPHWESVSRLVEGLPFRCELLRAVEDMTGLMQWADLAVSAAGSTCWELCYFGVPMILVIAADNQAGNGFALAESGAAEVLAPGSDRARLAGLVRDVVEDAKRRGSMAENGWNLVDGKGAERVAEYCMTGVA